MGLTDDKKADLWMQHSHMMWRTVYVSPLIGITIFAGWHTMLEKQNDILANTILVTGIAIMIVQWAIIRRMAQYTMSLFKEVEDQLEEVPPPVFGLTGSRVAKGVPVIIAILFGLLLYFGGITAPISN